MAVRVPSSIQKLLPFCRRWEAARADAPFATFAHLVSFSACFGFACRADRPRRASDFLNSPYPIDFGVFREHCSVQAFVIVLASAESEEVLHDEGRMCAILEDYAAFGGEELTRIIDDLGEESFLPELARRFCDFQAPDSPLQI